jgi:hypothetical protein
VYGSALLGEAHGLELAARVRGQPYEIVFFFLAAALVTGFFLAGILSGTLSMLRFRASMMSTTLPPRSGAGAEMQYQVGACTYLSRN